MARQGQASGRKQGPPGRRPRDAIGEVYSSPGGWSWLRADANPYAQDYPPDAEPSLRDLLLRQQRKTWPPARLPERRFRELEDMLGVKAGSYAFRYRLYEILETTVCCDKRISPTQRDAARWCEERDERHARRFKDIDKTARALQRLLTDEDAREQRDIRYGSGFPHPGPNGDPGTEFVERLGAVADSAQWSAKQGRRGRGGPKHDIPAWLIAHLGDLYMQATGEAKVGRSTGAADRAGIPGGPFFRFVRYVYDWLGEPYSDKSDEAVAGDIRRYKSGRVRRWEPWLLGGLIADRVPPATG